jgi:hypothetical protein
MFQALDGRPCGGCLAVESGDLAPEPLEACLALALSGPLVAFQPADCQAERLGGRPALVRLGLGPQKVKLGREAAGLQASEELSLLGCGARRHLRLAMPGARFLERHPGCVPLFTPDLFFGRDLLVERAELDRQVGDAKYRILYAKRFFKAHDGGRRNPPLFTEIDDFDEGNAGY